MIEAWWTSTRSDDGHAADELSFTVRSGVVTVFFGPQGAGTSTTLRIWSPEAPTLAVSSEDASTDLTGNAAKHRAPAPAPRIASRAPWRWRVQTPPAHVPLTHLTLVKQRHQHVLDLLDTARALTAEEHRVAAAPLDLTSSP